MTPRFTTLQGWLQWQETLHPSVIDLGLSRIHQVAVELFGEHFQKQQPLTITVAGTNGKGSCVTSLAALLHGVGKRVGSFTSPHLFHYNERIRIDGTPVSDADLCAAFAAIDAARGDSSLTYFEFNALAAFWLFRRYCVDVQVLEVGLGGRLDATNLLDADIAVITNIALDHVEWLGDTREKIGAEKAGILRANGKLVYGERDMPDSIRQQADVLGVAVRQMERQFSASIGRDGMMWCGQDVAGKNLSLTCTASPLPLPSVACALQVMAWLNLWDSGIFSALLPAILLPGRMENIICSDGHWILDVAHNEAGAAFLCDRLLQAGFCDMTLVFSAMADKDLAAIFAVLKPLVSQWVLFPLPDNSRAATLEQLQAATLQSGIDSRSIHCCGDAILAAKKARQQASGKTVLVCGSFFTVAAIKTVLS